MAARAEVPIAFGTDLLGAMHAQQSHEFTLRAQVQSPAEIVRSATIVGARLLRLEGQVGVVAPGAYADLLLMDGSPLEDVRVLAEPDRHLRLVMQAGRVAHEVSVD
jgi:imidazolonepropionase-like amidohydrolase